MIVPLNAPNIVNDKLRPAHFLGVVWVGVSHTGRDEASKCLGWRESQRILLWGQISGVSQSSGVAKSAICRQRRRMHDGNEDADAKT